MGDGKPKNLLGMIHDISLMVGKDTGDVCNTIFHLMWKGEICTDMDYLILSDAEVDRKVTVWRGRGQKWMV